MSEGPGLLRWLKNLRQNTKHPDSDLPGLTVLEAGLLLMENDTAQSFSNTERFTFFLITETNNKVYNCRENELSIHTNKWPRQ